MAKRNMILVSAVLILVIVLIAVSLFVFNRVFPSLNDYDWVYEQEFIDEHDQDMVIDGKLDEQRWSDQHWLTHSHDGVNLKYTTVFTEYGLYVGAVVEDDDLQWNKRFNFAKYTPDASNSAFHFRISHSDALQATTFNCYNFYVDTQDSASRNQTRHEAKSSLNGVLNPQDGETKATQMTAELFVSWDALHLTDGKPENIRIYPEYRHVVGESSEENSWIKPTCYEEGTARMFLSALFGESGYINVDKSNALLGDSLTGMSKSDGWDISQADEGKVSASDYYQQNIFYKGIFSDAYIYSTTMKITGEQVNEVGYAGVFDATDDENVNVFYIDVRGVLDGSETLTLRMMDYYRWEVKTIGTIPNKPSYLTEGIPITVIKDDTHLYYLVDGILVHSEDVSFVGGKSSPGLFTLRASAQYEACEVVDYANKKDELKSIVSEYVYSVAIEGKISGGSVTTDVAALPKAGKTAGSDLTLSILAENGYILSELTIDGTSAASNDYLAYAAKNMVYGSLVIPKERITGDVVISAKFTNITKVFGKDAVEIISGTVTNAVGAKQSAKIVIHNQNCISPLLSSVTQSGVTGAFDIYLLKEGTYTIGSGVTITSDGKYILGASNSGYVTEYVNANTGNTEPISIVLAKNKVSDGYAETGDGGYKSQRAGAHNHFVDGIGKTWTANLTLPAMVEDQAVGYVLHLAEPSVTWTNWMRIAAVMKNGKLSILTHMNVDKEIYAQKYYDMGISAANAEGKNLHLLLENGKLNCYLDDKLVFVYTDYSVINDYTVSQVLSLNNKVACGLYNSHANVVLRKFSFTTDEIPQGEVLHRVSGTVTADTDALRRFQIVVTDTKTGNIYITNVDREGNFLMDLPTGEYRFSLKHSSQDKFFYPTPVENNVISVSQNIDNVSFTAKAITETIGTVNVDLDIPLVNVTSDAFKLKLKHKEYGEFTVYRNLDGSFTTNAPVGEYTLSVKHATESLFAENRFTVSVKEGDNNKSVTLRKNAITNGSYTLTNNLYYQSNGTHRHNMFEQAYGDAWEATLQMPALSAGQKVGFVVHGYKNNAVVWGNWFRLMVERTEDGKLQLVSHIGADKTQDRAAINVISSRLTDINADDVVGKTLKIVYKNGVLSLCLDDWILNLYTNNTYLASEGKSSQVKAVLDLNGDLTCGLLTSHKDMVIKDWAFTNVEEYVSATPALNGVLKGKVQLSIDTMKPDQMRITLHSTDVKTSLHTYAKADGTYEIKAPAGEYILEVSNDGVAAYTLYKENVTVTTSGTTKDIILTSKNAINNETFILTEDGYFKSTKGYGHNSFVNGYGDVWAATLEMPVLNSGQKVGFVVHGYKNDAAVWGNWLRLTLERTEDGKLLLAAHMGADKTEESAAINVLSSRLTDINADDVVGKTLKIIYKDGVLALRLDDQILNLYTNDTWLASEGKSTQVKAVLDLNGYLTCGLLTSHKDMVIKDWAFTNIEDYVSENPAMDGTLKGKVQLSIDTMELDQVRITLHSADGRTSLHTYAKADGAYEIKAPAGEYILEVSNDGVAAYTLYKESVMVTKSGTTNDIILTSKNAINNESFILTEDGYFKSTKGYGHNSFVNGYGTAWEATLEMPTLNSGESVGFVVVKRANNDYAWGNWWRLTVERTNDGKLQLVSHIGADKTEESAAINVFSSRLTDINAEDVAGKTLQIVYKDGVLTLRLDNQILALYTNDSQLKGENATTQVKNVLDLTGELYCGLLTDTAGLVIKDWAFTNIKKNVTDNPVMNGALSGKVELSVSGVSYSDVLIALNSTQDKTTYRTYASADGTYELAVPAGEYELVVTSAAYITRKQTITVTEGTNTYDIALASKNAVHNTTFAATEDCAYERTADGLAHTIFVQGYGNEWVANMVVPDLTAGQQVGFVLHKASNGAATWDHWMRILLSKTSDGKLQLYTQMAAGSTLNVTKTVTLSDASVAGKTFQVVLRAGRIYVTLDGRLLANYVGSTKLDDSDATVGQVFDIDSGEVFCGLVANTAGIVITDWSFTNILDTEQLYMVSGTVSAGLKGTDLSQATLTFVDKADATKTYTVTADAAGKYSVALPTGDYTVTVSLANYVDNIHVCSVLGSDVTMDIAMRKNTVSDKTNYLLTEDGSYQSQANYKHDKFDGVGYGNLWIAELEIPDLEVGKGVGVVLHQANDNGDVVWGNWIRLYLEKQENGEIYLMANLVDNARKADVLTDASVDGKVLKVSMLGGRLFVAIDDAVIAVYDKDTRMDSGNKTLDGVLNLSGKNGLYCGLYAQTSGIVFTDWNFTNVLDADQVYTVSGTVSAGLKGANLSQATLTFVNKADSTKTYTVTADATGNYSVDLPVGGYTLTVTHPDYVDNILTCTVLSGNVTKNIRLRKNIVENGNFAVTQEGFYQSTRVDTHNVLKGASGTAWEAEVKMPELTEGQGAGFILIKANASGGITWDKWMQLYIRKTNSGYELFANILNNTYKVDKLSATAVEGKSFKVTVLNSQVIASLDDEVIGIYDKDTVMDPGGSHTVDSVLGLTGTTGLYCGLFAKTKDFVITDWNFSNVFQAD